MYRTGGVVGLIVLVTGLLVAGSLVRMGPSGASLSEPSPTSTPTAQAVAPLAIESIPVLAEAKTLSGLDGWLQAGDVETLEDLRGQVVVLQFWTFGCFNCKNTIPNLQSLYAEHGDRPDFEIVGVHAPEFDHEKNPASIQQAAIDLGVTWPIALDTEKKNFSAWQGNRRFWPRTYVLDRDGRIRFDRVGEGAYNQLNETVAALLASDA